MTLNAVSQAVQVFTLVKQNKALADPNIVFKNHRQSGRETEQI